MHPAALFTRPDTAHVEILFPSYMVSRTEQPAT